MPKGNRIGRTANTTAPATSNGETPANINGKTDKQIAYEQMTDEEAAALAQKLRSKPNSYYDQQGLNGSNPTQRLVEELDMNQKPVVVDDDTFNKLAKAQNAVVLYRGVTDNGTLSGKDIANQTMYGDKTYVGDGIHGNGLYFSTDQRTAKSYARYGNSGAVMKAMIDPSKARVIDEDTLLRMWGNEVRPNSTYRDIANLAIKKGYNVIHAPGGNGSTPYNKKTGRGEDFYIPIDRSALIFSSSVDQP